MSLRGLSLGLHREPGTGFTHLLENRDNIHSGTAGKRGKKEGFRTRSRILATIIDRGIHEDFMAIYIGLECHAFFPDSGYFIFHSLPPNA